MASQSPFPFMVPRSVERRIEHFDETVYTATPTTLLYKFIDATCGVAGAGSLLNEIFLARAAGALETIYFNDLDYIFGSVHFLSRSPAESYDYTPMIDMLTSDQWDEVAVKDAWYRDRIRQFFIACGLGGTPEGIRTCVNAAVGVGCDLFEVWRYNHNFGLGDDLGRAPTSSDNELVIRPHKTTLLPEENRLLRDMLERIAPVDSIITVDLQGLAVSTPVGINAATADTTYYQVEKMVTGTPLLEQLPPPELLPIDLLSTEQWMWASDPTLAPYAAFNITSEYGYYYLAGDSKRSPIDTVTYGSLQADGVTVRTEPNFEVYETHEEFTEWHTYEKADSPDNFPGGKYGIHPTKEPALNPDGSPYRFSFISQLAYVTQQILEVLFLGGVAHETQYKLPLTHSHQTKKEFLPVYAIANEAPASDSTITASTTKRRYRPSSGEQRDPAVFVR